MGFAAAGVAGFDALGASAFFAAELPPLRPNRPPKGFEDGDFWAAGFGSSALFTGVVFFPSADAAALDAVGAFDFFAPALAPLPLPNKPPNGFAEGFFAAGALASTEGEAGDDAGIGATGFPAFVRSGALRGGNFFAGAAGASGFDGEAAAAIGDAFAGALGVGAGLRAAGFGFGASFFGAATGFFTAGWGFLTGEGAAAFGAGGGGDGAGADPDGGVAGLLSGASAGDDEGDFGRGASTFSTGCLIEDIIPRKKQYLERLDSCPREFMTS